MSGPEASMRAVRQRRDFANHNAVTEYEADLLSEDRYTQREAVRKYLAKKVRNDWIYQWPQTPHEPILNSKIVTTTEEELAVILRERKGNHYDDEDEDQELGWQEREEWHSNASDSEIHNRDVSISTLDSPGVGTSPDGDDVELTEDNLSKKLYAFRRKRIDQLQEELAWNDGLRCFTARRNAWTCARTVCKPIEKGNLKLDHKNLEIEEAIEIPIGRPILPPENLVRNSITPRSYSLIYDKIILNSITPTCPINLKDMISSCVQGWKRDGQWPQPSSGLTKKLSQKHHNRQAMDILFPQDKFHHDTNNEAKKGDEKYSERSELQRQRQRGRAREKEINDSKEKRRGLSTYLNRILGRGP